VRPGTRRGGMSHDKILADYADLDLEDLRTVLEFAAHLSRTTLIDPLAA
jgi:uncharacterized protein (DUF433 family)